MRNVKPPFKIGIMGYTNLISGIGIFDWELYHQFGDSILSVGYPRKGGQEVWSDRQVSCSTYPTIKDISLYFHSYKPDILLFLETPWYNRVYDLARKHRVKVVAIPMHESYGTKMLDRADMIICTCREAWNKIKHKNKRFLHLPISLELFPFKRRKGHTFLLPLGYGDPNGRRQAVKVIQAFRELKNEDAKLIICQQKDYWEKELRSKDPRITYIGKSRPLPGDIYNEGDISICVMAYGGYERLILESMASGMPTLTTDADPMRTYQNDPEFLVPVSLREMMTNTWVYRTMFNHVSVGDLKRKMEWLLEINTSEYSVEARKQAEKLSWQCKEVNYRKIWLDILGEVLD